MIASIIMPTYNKVAYLAEAIDSCLDQTEEDFEIIVVDDGSTDSTPDLLEYYAKNPKIKCYRKENGGPASAMNYGCRKATGDILLFAASDDIQMTNKIATSIAGLIGVDFMYSGYYHANVKGEPWEYVKPKPLTKESLKACDCASGGALAMWKKTFEKIPYREELRLNEDQAWLIDAFKAGLTYNIVDEPTYLYRLLPSGLSYKYKKEVEAITETLLKELDET